jgi:hypothetical protein
MKPDSPIPRPVGLGPKPFTHILQNTSFFQIIICLSSNQSFTAYPHHCLSNSKKTDNLYSVKHTKQFRTEAEGRGSRGLDPAQHFYKMTEYTIFSKHSPSINLPVIYSTFQHTDRYFQKVSKYNILYSVKRQKHPRRALSVSVQLLFCHFLFSPIFQIHTPSIILPVIYSIFQDTDR